MAYFWFLLCKKKKISLKPLLSGFLYQVAELNPNQWTEVGQGLIEVGIPCVGKSERQTCKGSRSVPWIGRTFSGWYLSIAIMVPEAKANSKAEVPWMNLAFIPGRPSITHKRSVEVGRACLGYSHLDWGQCKLTARLAAWPTVLWTAGASGQCPQHQKHQSGLVRSSDAVLLSCLRLLGICLPGTGLNTLLKKIIQYNSWLQHSKEAHPIILTIEPSGNWNWHSERLSICLLLLAD